MNAEPPVYPQRHRTQADQARLTRRKPRTVLRICHSNTNSSSLGDSSEFHLASRSVNHSVTTTPGLPCKLRTPKGHRKKAPDLGDKRGEQYPAYLRREWPYPTRGRSARGRDCNKNTFARRHYCLNQRHHVSRCKLKRHH